MDTHDKTDNSCQQDTDQDRPFYLAGHQDGNNQDSDQRQERPWSSQVAEGNLCRLIADNDPGILQADEGDKDPDSGGNCTFKAGWDSGINVADRP